MGALRLDPDQRFTCSQCGRCCRRGWDIALTPGEVKAYRQAKAERYYREREDVPEGADADPFEPLPGGYARIRKRAAGLRMARFLEDLSRHRVARLSPPRLAEYVELTGRYAAKSEQPLPPRPPSALGRLLFRGFLFAVVAAREQLEDPRPSGLRL